MLGTPKQTPRQQQQQKQVPVKTGKKGVATPQPKKPVSRSPSPHPPPSPLQQPTVPASRKRAHVGDKHAMVTLRCTLVSCDYEVTGFYRSAFIEFTKHRVGISYWIASPSTN